MCSAEGWYRKGGQLRQRSALALVGFRLPSKLAPVSGNANGENALTSRGKKGAEVPKKKTVGPVPHGNRFEYYAPTPPSPGAAASPPKSKASIFVAKTKHGLIAKPASVIKSHYPKTTTVPFGSAGALSGDVVVSDLELAQAAIECGYGKRGLWSSALAMSKSQRRALQHHLIMRHEFVGSCLGVNAYKARTTRNFVAQLEKSELAAMSFIVGQYGAFLAAKRWLAAAGEKMAGFLHYDIYSKACVDTVATASTESRPDFLVPTKTASWHMFESKGGRYGERWASLAKGLQQLDTVDKVGWAGTTPVAPTSRVCVHTTFEPDEPIRVTAVDPPRDGQDSDGPAPELRLVKSVCRGLVALDTIDQFRALAGRPQKAPDDTFNGWLVGQTERLGGVKFHIPQLLLSVGGRLRVAIATWLEARDIATEQSLQGGQVSPQAVAEVMRLRRLLRANSLEQSAPEVRLVSAMYELVASAGDGQEFLPGLARQLGLDQLSTVLEDVVAMAERLQHEYADAWLATSGGMLLAPAGGRTRTAAVRG